MYYKYIPWPKLRMMYRRRRKVIEGVKMAAVIVPVVVLAMFWILM